MNIQDLKEKLVDHQHTSLVFSLDGKVISPGYHVTEIKHAQVTSLDCGRGIDQWEEIVVQLLDGSPDSTDNHMIVSRFLNIIDKATESLHLNVDAQLFFEFSPGNGTINKLIIDDINYASSLTTVRLTDTYPVCKPFLRFRESGNFQGVSDAETSCCTGRLPDRGNSCC